MPPRRATIRLLKNTLPFLFPGSEAYQPVTQPFRAEELRAKALSYVFAKPRDYKKFQKKFKKILDNSRFLY
jgi:hypothetical protein